MGISNDYDLLVISGKVKVGEPDLMKIKKLVEDGDLACLQAKGDSRNLGAKDDYAVILSLYFNGFANFAEGFLLACGVEVERENLFLALCARYPCLEMDLAILVSVQLKCGSTLSQMEWKRVEFYLRMYTGMFHDYACEQKWL